MNIRLLSRPGQGATLLTGSMLLSLAVGAPAPVLAQAPRNPVEEFAVGFGANGPEIGVTIRDATPEDAAAGRKGGATIESVRDDSPAARAGLRAGDLVTVFDGQRVRSARQLARLIDETPRDQHVSMSVLRSGAEVTLSVTPQLPTPWRAPWPGPDGPDAPLQDLLLQQRRNSVMPGLFTVPGAGRLGVQVHDLTTQLAEYFGAAGGVLVASVADNTPAQAAGLKAGDVITKVNGETVRDGAALRQRTASAAGQTTLTVVRDRQERTMSVELPAGPTVQRAPQRYSR